MPSSLNSFCTLLLGIALCFASAPALAGSLQIVYRFPGGAQGSLPIGPLVVGADGSLFGITHGGGSDNGNGVVFKISFDGHAWHETVLHTFEGPSGDEPTAALVQDSAGTLYGNLEYHGGAGAVFDIAPPQAGQVAKYAIIYTFPNFLPSPNGAFPIGSPVLDGEGHIFGITETHLGLSGSGSVIYELIPPASGAGPWTEAILHTFNRSHDPALPAAGLTLGPDGTLYGTSSEGGAGDCVDPTTFTYIGCGTVFREYNTANGWRDAVLYSFRVHEAYPPADTLTLGRDGALYSESAGVDVYRVVPLHGQAGPWHRQVLYSVAGSNLALGGAPVFDPQGNLYDTTTALFPGALPGQSGTPALFRLSPPPHAGEPWIEETLARFSGTSLQGLSPYGALVRAPDGTFYGTAAGPAPENQPGLVFAYQP